MVKGKAETVLNDEEQSSMANKQLIKYGIVAFLLLLLALGSFKIVGSTEKGVKFRLGAVSGGILNPGFNWKVPFINSVETVSIQPIQTDLVVPVGESGAITKDNMTVGADTTIFYAYVPDRIQEMWTQYGEERIQSLSTSALKESFKDVLGQYTIYNVAVAQAEIREKVVASVKVKLSSYPITVTEVRIQNYTWSEAFDKAIESTMQAAQLVKEKQQELQTQDLESQKLVKVAESTKAATIATAEREKQAVVLRAEAKAAEGEGLRKYAESVAKNQELQIKLLELEIQKIRAGKYNGVEVPAQVFSPIPFTSGIPVK